MIIKSRFKACVSSPGGSEFLPNRCDREVPGNLSKVGGADNAKRPEARVTPKGGPLGGSNSAYTQNFEDQVDRAFGFPLVFFFARAQ